ncbi:Uncharacterized protein dnl_48270 [Desulfonema limicola]|uniref:Zinc resistance-associated protein n=1 Tax=Desulfonema limicola TaxID=45656 RepID=A0A975GIC9_9BACT|nr:hypothetical protein [Desulfonema limicola]QTA82452.1 Uncharacterized protein dnl_48270 [Desulfonema limicola]
MKKTIMTLIIALTIGLMASQVWAWRSGCPMAAGAAQAGDISPEAYQKFMDDTAQLRLDLAAKNGEYDAVLAQTNPDPKQAGQIAREMAEIQAKIQAKAKENGLPAMGCCRGTGQGKMGKGYHGKKMPGPGCARFQE